jgi:hypothetical protein
MKAGEIVTFAHRAGDKLSKIPAHSGLAGRNAVLCNEPAYVEYGTHSSPEYGISDASEPVTNGTAVYVVVCKVIAVVKRSVKVET